MAEIADNPELRSEMGFRAEEHAKEHLTLDCISIDFSQQRSDDDSRYE